MARPLEFIGQSLLESHRLQVEYYTISSYEALQSVLGYGLRLRGQRQQLQRQHPSIPTYGSLWLG